MGPLAPEEKLNLYYFQALDLWKHFCDTHNELYKLTCEEYQALLSGEVNTVETLTKTKADLIDTIKGLDKIRSELISNINSDLDEEHKIRNVKDLINFLSLVEAPHSDSILKKANSLLIDIIEGIQKQNKKNQLFINKALISLRDIKDAALGRKQYQQYNASGSSSRSVR